MRLRPSTTLGGSSLYNAVGRFTALDNLSDSVMILPCRNTYLPQEQPVAPRHLGLFIDELTRLLLIFVLDSHTILSTHRVHGSSAAWCFTETVLQWYTGSGVHIPYPRPIKLLCSRCYLNFRRACDLHVPCYWCEMMQGMGYPPRF